MLAVEPRRTRMLLVTSRGLLRVQVCPLCGALIVADGAEQHEAVHARALGADRPGEQE
ncbi:MAG: hypothetical protein L0K86_24675 [Actinomycetia bacterium]|nr:hypothetical protein [Actinomycetes bacterium]